MGNALGACAFNPVFLVGVDAMQRRQPMYRRAGQVHQLSAAFGVVMLGLVALGLLAGGQAPGLLHLGVYSPLLLGVYLFRVAQPAHA